MNKVALGSVDEMRSGPFEEFINEFESFSYVIGLDPYVRYCRLWEYPWLWFNGLEHAEDPILDIGSALSPLPWFLAAHNHKVAMTEVTDEFIPTWRNLSTYNMADWFICRDERLPFPDNFFGTVCSVSVIEHQPNKEMAIAEIIRVLKPGGMFALSFDLFEPSMGMVYPRQDIPMMLKSFESLIWMNPAFGNTELPEWNLKDIPKFLAWHSTTAPQHTYVSGASILYKRT